MRPTYLAEIQLELNALGLQRLGAGGRHRLIVAMMWRPDAARAHGADSGEAAIELGWTRGKVVRPHAPGTDRQRDQDDKHFDEWGGEPGHRATNASAMPCHGVRSLHDAARGCSRADLRFVIELQP